MSLEEDEKKAQKRARSEAQRLESIRAKKQLEKQRQDVLSQALRKVDQKSKRVVFEDSDENEENPSTSSQNVSVITTATKCPKLFEESSSEHSDDDKDQFKITNRHEGKKGEKLMKLEAKFNSDSRFQLDEKFESSGSDDDDENEATQERLKNLELLSKVLGSTVKPQKKTLKSSMKETKTGQAAVRPFTRFDPFNEEHVRWLQEEEADTSCKKDEVDEDELSETTASKLINKNEKKKVNGFHYEMQANFAEELKARLAGQFGATDSGSNDGDANFSFLAMMGRAAPSTEPKPNLIGEEKGVDIVSNKKLKAILRNDYDENEDDGVIAKIAAPCRKPPFAGVSTSKFFVIGNEPYLQSLVSNFKRTQPLEKIVPRWANHRDIFIKNYKHLRKAALKERRQKILRDNGHAESKNAEKRKKSFTRKRRAKEETG
ncbi:hypothetical protein RB195_002226 [Necator americanus]|uniref:SART-1 family protein n=1 Tax=Necator americanus TaxID=51031 RepID=A0ABR1DJI9_NECAM